MTIPKLPLLAAVLPLAATLFLAPAQLRADTYEIFDLGSDNARNIVGIDTSGEVVIANGILFTYQTYSNGVVVNTTSTKPSLTYDDGTPCSPPGSVPSGFALALSSESVCNNGRTGFGSSFNPNGDASGVYTGPISSLTLIDASGTTDEAFLNASGDFAWSDGVHEENFEAIDITTPEPGSLLLFGTGCLGLLGVLRRKLS
jgi:PEP-CTERM motif